MDPFYVLLIVFVVWCFIASVLTYRHYLLDKEYADVQGTWLTSECALHTWALVGGWPGAFLAQRRLHHKTNKRKFQIIFWITVLIHCSISVTAIFLCARFIPSWP